MKLLWWMLAYASCVAGMGCLALAMESHWEQVRGSARASRRAVTALRVLGVAGLLGSLLACLRADHASMAALVWVMTLAASALTVAFSLTWCPRVLVPLAAWVRARPAHAE